MYYRRTREEMPASDAEIEEAHRGRDRHPVPRRAGLDPGRGRQPEDPDASAMALGEPDASGRRRPVPVDGSEYAVPVDTIISAVGQYSDTKLLSGSRASSTRRATSRRTWRRAAPRSRACSPPGDLLTGTDIAIRAIAGGKHAARAALAYLEGRDVPAAEGVPEQEGRLQGARPPRISRKPRARRAHADRHGSRRRGRRSSRRSSPP